jgi:hypothetical protein
MATNAQNLQVVFRTKEPFNENIPRDKTVLWMDDGFNVIHHYIFRGPFTFTEST